MFGVTTPGVTAARERMEELGYEVLVFHATGTGGQSMEALMKGGFINGIAGHDDDGARRRARGGVLSAGPDRLEAAGELGIPQVVSLGALDMVNFGPADTVPETFKGAPSVRPQPDGDPHAHDSGGVRRARVPDRDEAERGEGPDGTVRPAQGRVDDRRRRPGLSRPAANDALIAALREHISPSVEVHELNTDINDPKFAVAMANRLDELYRAWVAR